MSASNDIQSKSEKDWAYEMSLLPWDSTVTFTKQSLFEFLKYTGCTVDTSLLNIKQLPRYATFSKSDASAPATKEAEPAPGTLTSQSSKVVDASGQAFRPTRKVQDVPGGSSARIAALFGGDEDHDEPLSARKAPSPVPAPDVSPLSVRETPSPQQNASSKEPLRHADGSRITRRVKDVPGGQSSMASLLAGDS